MTEITPQLLQQILVEEGEFCFVFHIRESFRLDGFNVIVSVVYIDVSLVNVNYDIIENNGNMHQPSVNTKIEIIDWRSGTDHRWMGIKSIKRAEFFGIAIVDKQGF